MVSWLTKPFRHYGATASSAVTNGSPKSCPSAAPSASVEHGIGFVAWNPEDTEAETVAERMNSFRLTVEGVQREAWLRGQELVRLL